MWLDANSLTGSIPTEIGLLTELASLSITNGTLTGEIPTEMGNLLGLRRAWLYGNDLTGTIPLAMQNLTLLEVFEVQDNDLGGTMPEGVCTTVNSQTYQHKSLAADCQQVECPLNSCCTTCVN
jgi:Leucine-rich repeat (LRR) protein